MQWGQATVEGAASVPARMMDGRDATTQAIKDLEEAMNDVRMAGINATAACMRDQSKLADARCPVPAKTLALAGHTRILAAAQQPSPASILEDMYGPLFPFSALDASDSAVQRVEAAAEYDRSRNLAPVVSGGDPLAVAHVVLPDQSEASANGEPQRSGSVSSAISGIAGRMRMPGRRRSSTVDGGDEDGDASGLGGLGGPVRPQRSPQQAPAPAAAAAADPNDALAAPAPPPPTRSTGADPLGDPLSGGGLGPGLGFGTDPLAATRAPAMRTPPPQNGQHEEEEEDDDEEEEPQGRAPRAQPSTGPRAAPPRPAPSRPPPRRAPPGPGAGAPRTAPPAPGIGGRPAPLRAAPGRPAPVQSRPAPMRAAPGRDNLPL